jgi:hypothetical protein
MIKIILKIKGQKTILSLYKKIRGALQENSSKQARESGLKEQK